MCGLVAIFNYRQDVANVNKAELRIIRDHMLARGPDGEGEWYSADGQVGLGHRRLAIIDVSTDGLQPMATADGRLQLVFNGEIYNYLDLRRELAMRGYRFRTKTDTEVLLAGWQEWGESLVAHLRGMFSFCLWDDSRRGLFVARDPFGIKPLYWADDGSTIRFASQVRALLAGGAVDTVPEAAGHVGFFLWGNVPEPYTLFKSVRMFAAGSTLWIGQDGRRIQRQYASLSELLFSAEQKSAAWSPQEIQERLRLAVRDSVSKHLLADVPVGVFLSAGIDSNVLAAVADEVSTDPIHTLTLGFNEYRETADDEIALAEGSAQRFGYRHDTWWIGASHFAEERNAFLSAMDQPTVDGLNVWFISKMAQHFGCKVTLSGLGGDELLGGYPSFEQIPRLVQRLKPLHRLRGSVGRSIRRILAPCCSVLTSPKYAGLLEFGTHESGAYLLRRGLFMPWELRSCLPAEIVAEGLPWVLQDLNDRVAAQSLGVKSLISMLESTLYMRNQLLRDADWASMAHHVELRVPLIDLAVLAAASRANKQTLARIPKLGLPDAITDRSKTGFSIPVRQWMMQADRTNSERGLRGWSRAIYAHYTTTAA